MSWLTVSVFGARFAYAVGRLSMRLVPSGPLGSCGGSTYIALHQTWLVSADLPCGFGAQVGVSYFLCDIPHVSMAIILSVSLTPACPCLVFTLGAVPWTLD